MFESVEIYSIYFVFLKYILYWKTPPSDGRDVDVDVYTEFF